MNWDIDPMFRIIYYPFVSIYQLNCSSFFPIGWSTNWESMNSWCGPRWIIVTCKEIEKITITLITPMFFPSFFYTFGFWFEILCIHGHVEMMTYQSLRSFICSTLFEARTTCSSVFFRGKLDVWYTYIVIAYVCSAPKNSLSCCKASTRVFVSRVRGFPTKMVRWVDVSNSFTSTYISWYPNLRT